MTTDEIRQHEEGLAELAREQGVRQRCFDGWVSSGKLTAFEAKERMTRLQYAIKILKNQLDIALHSAVQVPAAAGTDRGGEGVPANGTVAGAKTELHTDHSKDEVPF